MTLDATFVRTLADGRDRIVPVLGAGMAVDAGVPAAQRLAELLAREAGVALGERSLWQVCEEIEAKHGADAMRKLAADTITGCELHSTPTLELLARAPTGLILTTNYDSAIELAGEAAGKSVTPLLPSDLRCLQAVPEEHLHVVHLHGIASDPETLAISSAQRRALLHDDAMQMFLRGIAAAWQLLFLGFRLSPEEAHMRNELAWIGSLYDEQEPHPILLPASETGNRTDLDLPVADEVLRVFEFDERDGYGPVREAALILAPKAPLLVESIERKSSRGSEYFAEPVLLRHEKSDAESGDEAGTVAMAELGLGERRFAKPGELAQAQRALLIASPGMGKTETLLACGRQAGDGRAVFARLSRLPGYIGNGPLETSFARFVAAEGEAFDEGTPLPTADSLEDGSYCLLLDGLDECAPERQGDAVAAVEAALARWPQHAYVVATRPTTNAQELLDAGFAAFRIHESEAWGRRYLALRGVVPERIDELFARAPTVAPLLAVPMYARALGELLVKDRGLPDTPMELILAADRETVMREAQRTGTANRQLFDWLARLAIALEVSGRVEARTEELAHIEGAGAFSSESARVELIRSALLRDLPDVARLNTRTVQEAHCAAGILGTADPVKTLSEVAIAEVAGEKVFRADLEHVVDLVFQAAGPELRGRLRELDELRWARTQRADGAPEDIEAAMHVIRRWFTDRLLWLDNARENQVQGAAQTLEQLHRAQPTVLEGWREELIAETRSPERTVRGNAIEFLALLEADENTADWLLPRLRDSDAVVRRFAARVVADFELAEAKGALFEAWDAESDELAMEAIGDAILALTKNRNVPAIASRLSTKPVGWSRINRDVIARLNPEGTLDLLERNVLGENMAFDLLDRQFDDFDDEADWPADLVQRLSRWVAARASGSHRPRRSEKLADLVAASPAAALRGAAQAEGEFKWFDFFWLRKVDRERLAGAATGALEKPLKELLEHTVPREDIPFEDELSSEVTMPVRPPILADLLDAGEYDESTVPAPEVIWSSKDLSPERRERLLELAEGWFPSEPADWVASTGSKRSISNGFFAALTVLAKFDAESTREQWLALFVHGAFSFDHRIVGWGRSRYDPEWAAEAAEAVRSFDADWQVRAAIAAIPRWDPELARAFAGAIAVADEVTGVDIVERLGREGFSELLTDLSDSAPSTPLRKRARLELARLGDAEAQLEALEEMARELEDNSNAYERHGIEWNDAITDRKTLPLLERLLRAIHRCHDAFVMRRTVEAAIANMDEEGLAVYDRLIADRDLEGSSFYWYQRNELARELARRRVMERLSGELAGVAELFQSLGYPR